MTLVLTFLFMLLIVAAMAIGVMRGRAPISGSCGGMARLGLNTACEVCGGNPAKCKEGGPAMDAKTAARLSHDAAEIDDRNG